MNLTSCMLPAASCPRASARSGRRGSMRVARAASSWRSMRLPTQSRRPWPTLRMIATTSPGRGSSVGLTGCGSWRASCPPGGSSLRLSPFGQRLWRRRALRRDLEQFGNWYRKDSSKPVEYVDSRVLFSPLNATDIGAIDSCIIGQPLLRETALNPDPPQVPGHQCSPVHESRQPCRCLLNHGL